MGKLSSRAIKKCFEWLAFCLSIGWRKDQLDDLEALWWKYHNDNGELIQPEKV